MEKHSEKRKYMGVTSKSHIKPQIPKIMKSFLEYTLISSMMIIIIIGYYLGSNKMRSPNFKHEEKHYFSQL